jgi:hypothetical protein
MYPFSSLLREVTTRFCASGIKGVVLHASVAWQLVEPTVQDLLELHALQW